MRDPWLRKIVIAFAAMGGTSFYKATVTDADFTGATLKNVNFNRAILTRTCFKDTVKLNLARPLDFGQKKFVSVYFTLN